MKDVCRCGVTKDGLFHICPKCGKMIGNHSLDEWRHIPE